MSDDSRDTRDELDPHYEEISDQQDDAVIGHALKWSLAAMGVIAVGVAALLLLGREASTEVVVEKRLGQVSELPAAQREIPEVRFEDVTEQAGIRFRHVSGAAGEKLLPETMGGGVGFFDYDGDNDQDLLFVNSTDWSTWNKVRAGQWATGVSMALYRNDGGGNFSDVAGSVGLSRPLYGMGLAAADYDADGDVDLFVTALGPNRLYRNDNGRFVDITKPAGVAGHADAWSTSAGFFDYDNDGDLDLFVCNYVKWSREIDMELNFSLNGVDRAYGPPTNYAGTYNYLYRNEGNGAFVDVSAEAGIQIDNPITGDPMGKGLALTFVDLDKDGFLDVVVANDTVQNYLLHNQQDGTFAEIGGVSGIGFDSAGNATGAMGIDAAHYRGDETIGIAVGNFANEMTSLFTTQGNALQFSDDAIGEGIGSPTRLVLSFGLFFFDYDLDGAEDLLQANGHLEEEISEVQASQHYRQPAQLFWNAGPDQAACFVEVPKEDTGGLAEPIVGRGAAYADIDADGDLDVVLTQTGGPPLLLRNDQQLGHHWLRVKLVGDAGNQDAIGAWVELTADGVTQRKQVMPTRSYLSQVELPLTFGLGKTDEVETLTVTWPDGLVQTVEVEAVDRAIVVSKSGA